MNTAATAEWETPAPFFAELDREFAFTLDAAATADNAKCGRFLTARDDALLTPWGDARVWLNPPYGMGNLARWVKRAHEMAIAGAVVVCLLPARTDAAWFHDIAQPFGQLRFVRGRLKFGGSPHNAPFPSLVVVFRPEAR